MFGRQLRSVVVAAAATIGLTACFEPDLVTCPDGRQCAKDEVCDTAHEICVAPDQLANCASDADGTACMWTTGTGQCFSHVCLEPGCGNYVVEAGEQCDDGNRVSGDGCSADCTSNEQCGNGVVDVLEGEKCDDHNLVSRDGCDSKCQLEAPVWTTVGVDPLLGLAGHGAFDEHRSRFVYYADQLTWEWVDTEWQVVSTGGPSTEPVWYALVYDSDRQVTTLVGASTSFAGGSAPIDLQWEWDGTTWTERPAAMSSAFAQGALGVAVYDRVLKQTVVYTHGTMWSWDAAAELWSSFAVDPGFFAPSVGGYSMAYDVLRHQIVLVIGGFTFNPSLAEPGQAPQTWVYNDVGGTWTGDGAAGLGAGGLPIGAPSLVYDPALPGVLGLGGVSVQKDNSEAGTFSYSASVLQLSTTTNTWSAATAMTLPFARFSTAAVYDTNANRVLAFGGEDGTTGTDAHDDLYAFEAPSGGSGSAAWTALDTSFPHGQPRHFTAIDGKTGALVLLQGDGNTTNETWTWDGAWHPLGAASPTVAAATAMSYDPIRDAVVMIGGATTMQLLGGTWIQLGTGSGLANPYDTTFDPAHRRMVALADPDATGTPSLYELPSDAIGDAAIWTKTGVPIPVPTSTASMAFDAQNSVLVVLTDLREVFTYNGTEWLTTLSPSSADYDVVADERRGSVDFVAPGDSLWEREGGNWTEAAGEPVAVAGTADYDPGSGRVIVLGQVGQTSRVIETRQLTSALAQETCQPGIDADGDGLADCADEDCWWTCMPACPPLASCPPAP